MSDASEVKRWWISDSTANRIEPLPSIKHLYVEVIAVEDHDRLVAELRAEVEKAQSIAWDRKCKAREHELTIATQARVIEKLKGMVSHYETCAIVDRYDDEKVPCDCGLEIELEAIEKQGEGT